MMGAPLTTAAYGSTRCPGCEKRFTDTPDQPVTENHETAENRGRVDSIGQRHRGIGRHEVTRRWHTDCLSAFHERAEESRRRAAEDNERTIRAICEAAGLDYDDVKRHHDAPRP